MKNAERRLYERICLDAPVFCEIIMGEERAPVLLKDISMGGIQVEKAPGKSIPRELLGQKVKVTTLPDELTRRIPKMEGTVSWMSAERLGIRFLNPLPLTQSELESIIRRCY